MNQEELFAQRLKELRQKRHLSLEELALKIGTTKTTLSRYENCTRSPKLKILGDLANFFEVPVDWLSGLSNELSIPGEDEENERFIELYSLLERKRKDRVFQYAKTELEEQNLLLDKQNEEISNKISNVTNEPFTLAAHSGDPNRTYSEEDIAKINEVLDEIEVKYENRKPIKDRSKFKEE